MSNIKIGTNGNEFNERESAYKTYKDNTIQLMKLIISANLSTDDDVETICIFIQSKFEKGRLLYSVISDEIYSLEEMKLNNLESACEMLIDYSKSLSQDNQNELVNKVVLKLVDHINLALAQERYVKKYNNDALNDRLNNVDNFIKTVDEMDGRVSNLDNRIENMNGQVISVLGIFTAISFILFGGISSASSILEMLKKPSIGQLLIFGSIWGIIIFNVIYFLLYYVSKLTKISIKTNNRYGASVFRRHPYICLMNFFLCSIFVIGLWTYLIETTTGIKWLNMIVENNRDFLMFGSVVIISLIIIGFIIIIYKIKDESKDAYY